MIFEQDSTVSESVALWGLSTGSHKGEEEAVESLVAEIRDVQGRRWDREECMMKREGERKGQRGGEEEESGQRENGRRMKRGRKMEVRRKKR